MGEGLKFQKDLDLYKYMGTWYIIAAYPISIQKYFMRCEVVYQMLSRNTPNSMLKDVPLDPNGTSTLFTVQNKAIDIYGSVIKNTRGIAEVISEDNPAMINVSFEGSPAPDKTKPNYIIHYTDYQYSIVGSADKSTLFILARTPNIKIPRYFELRRKVVEFGYSTDNLVTSADALNKKSVDKEKIEAKETKYTFFERFIAAVFLITVLLICIDICIHIGRNIINNLSW